MAAGVQSIKVPPGDDGIDLELKFDAEQQIMSIAARKLHDYGQRVRAAPPDPGLRWAIAQYLRGNRRRLADRRGIRQRLVRFAAQFAARGADTPVSSITGAALDEWVRRTGWTSPKSQLAKLRACFSWCLRRDPPLIARNPFSAIVLDELPSDEEVGRAATHAEFLQLVRAARGKRMYRFRRLIVFALESGCRPMEIARLERRHIDLARGVAVLPAKEHKTGRRTKLARQIVLNPVAAGIVRSEMATIDREQPERTHLFVNERGEPWSNGRRAEVLTKKVHRLVMRHSLAKDLTLYCLRHAYGTRLALSKHTAVEIAQLMGNSPRIAERYIHLAAEVGHLLKAVTAASRVKIGVDRRAKPTAKSSRRPDLPGQGTLF